MRRIYRRAGIAAAMLLVGVALAAACTLATMAASPAPGPVPSCTAEAGGCCLC